MFGALIYANVILMLLAVLPPGLPTVRPSATILVFGTVGLWRWSWAGLHLLRALIYKRIVFPGFRRAAARAPRPANLYVLITSYRMAPELNAAVYARLLDEIAVYGVPAFIVACVTDPADATVIAHVIERRHDLPEGTALHVAMQAGTGKRPAMANALRAIMQRRPPPGSQVVLMDGDTLLGHGALAKTCAVLAAMPHIGAVTTDNIPLVRGHAITREWYRVRMAHRDSLMASISLSRKLLVLTGRFSVFRGDIAASAPFVQAIEQDVVDHPRLGRIEMVTGDDKSTWFTVLQQGWDMLYVPDVLVHPVEELPHGGFFKATTALMLRWYGNMARNNGRALALGPGRCRWFLWLCLLDQRLSMWTSLVGPTAAVALSMQHGYVCIIYYLLWVLVTRGAVCLIYFVTTGRFHPLFPIILYYNQVVGAWIKIYMMFHPDRQKWTRQAMKRKDGAGSGGFGQRVSTPYMAATIGAFALGTALFIGALRDTQRLVPSPGVAALLNAQVSVHARRDLPHGWACGSGRRPGTNPSQPASVNSTPCRTSRQLIALPPGALQGEGEISELGVLQDRRGPAFVVTAKEGGE